MPAPGFPTAWGMAGSPPNHTSYSSPNRRAVWTKYLLDIRPRFCFCKALTLLGFMEALRSWAYNCSHFTDRETEAWEVPLLAIETPTEALPKCLVSARMHTVRKTHFPSECILNEGNPGEGHKLLIQPLRKSGGISSSAQVPKPPGGQESNHRVQV